MLRKDGTGVINIDDGYGKRIVSEKPVNAQSGVQSDTGDKKENRYFSNKCK